MTETCDLLLEIGLEELPSFSVYPLGQTLALKLCEGLKQAGIDYDKHQFFATPRRIAVLITQVALLQADKRIERKGPSIKAAFDKNGQPTPAALGFAKSCGINVDQCQPQETAKGTFLTYTHLETGQPTQAILLDLITQALDQLPIAKPMHWGANALTFVRPVHWVVLMLGKTVIPGQLLGVPTDHLSYGHRFHDPKPFALTAPSEYENLLKEHHVIADFDKRKQDIKQQINAKANTIKGSAIICEPLLTEVTSIVEWPVALVIDFDSAFLNVPDEALISALEIHQKCFPIVNQDNQLLAHCITIANIDSKHPAQVVQGNAKVISARLSDAAFFFAQDQKHSLASRLTQLKAIIFQKDLGTLYDKAKRIESLSTALAHELGADPILAGRAGRLAKCDLTTDMVGEFPKLQGIMGRYYALNDQENEQVALAIEQHYHPRFSEDTLPNTTLGAIVALSDKLDTLFTIWGTGQWPTGDKDPFALRRNALGILHILIEQQWPLDLKTWLDKTNRIWVAQSKKTDTTKYIEPLLDFFRQRLEVWYKQQGIRPDVIKAVLKDKPTQPLDIHHRIAAVNHFVTLPEAKALAAANKRINNIVKKAKEIPSTINMNLLLKAEEKNLNQTLDSLSNAIAAPLAKGDYQTVLTLLAATRDAVDAFFDNILIMDNNIDLQHNRLALLNQFRELFLKVADIAELQQ